MHVYMYECIVAYPAGQSFDARGVSTNTYELSPSSTVVRRCWQIYMYILFSFVELIWDNLVRFIRPCRVRYIHTTRPGPWFLLSTYVPQCNTEYIHSFMHSQWEYSPFSVEELNSFQERILQNSVIASYFHWLRGSMRRSTTTSFGMVN